MMWAVRMIRPKAIRRKQITNPFPDRLIQIRLPFLIRQASIHSLHQTQMRLLKKDRLPILQILTRLMLLLQRLRTTRTWEEILARRLNRILMRMHRRLIHLIRPRLTLQHPIRLLHPATAPINANICGRSRTITNRDMTL